MARVIVLDSGPLGDACGRRGRPDVDRILDWLVYCRANGALIAIPEIADYEVRRGLLANDAMAGIDRLDGLRERFGLSYIPLSTDIMRLAAGLWAAARKQGRATASAEGLDADAIVAAQALSFTGATDTLTVATYNARHLSRYVADAAHWQAIAP